MSWKDNAPGRRCGWCGVSLRGWQINFCRRCKKALVHNPSPPCPSASRWTDRPDERRRWQ